MTAARLTAILTCHNRREATLACLRALVASAARLPGTRLDVVAVDDGSTDGTGDAVRDELPQATVLEGGGSRYWAGGMAQAEAHALLGQPDYLLWLNDDVLLDPAALTVLLEAARAAGSAGIVCGAVVDPVTGRLAYSGVRRRDWHPLRYDKVAPSARAEPVDTCNGNVVLVPRAVAERVGGIDGAFAHAYADYDYGLRVRACGGPVVLAPGVVGTCPANSEPEPWRRAGLPAREQWRLLLGRKGLPPRSHARFLRRHGGPSWPLVWAYPYLRLAARTARSARRSAVREVGRCG